MYDEPLNSLHLVTEIESSKISSKAHPDFRKVNSSTYRDRKRNKACIHTCIQIYVQSTAYLHSQVVTDQAVDRRNLCGIQNQVGKCSEIVRNFVFIFMKMCT